MIKTPLMKYFFMASAIQLLLVFVLNAQTGNPYIDIDFNDCQIQDIGQANVSLDVGGGPACGCGLEGDALYFDGIADYLTLDQDLSSLFGNDFTISFYIQIENDPNLALAVDLLSLQNECKRDSSFTLKYIPSIRECRFDIVKNLSRSTQINFELDEGRCWQHIVIVRDRFDYLVYLNGRLAGLEAAQTDYVFAPEARFSVCNSPCIGVSNDIRFEGGLEQLRIYDRALNELEIHGLDLYPDMILNNDTTLLLGESIQIRTGPECSDGFYWENTIDLDDGNSLTPVITPDNSETYRLYFQNGSCTSEDSIQIFVQNPDDLQCDELLLPNAFTPNGDELNDTFEISNKFIVEDVLSFDIYNRLGSRVFHGEDKTSAWDGSYLGRALNPGKFAYIVEYTCKGNQYQKRGIVTLIR